MYIGTDTGLVVIDKNGIVDSVPVTSAKTASGEPFDASNLVSLLRDSRVRSVIRDSKNRLWITSWQNLGLMCYDHGDLTIYNKDTGLLSDRVRSVYER
jgi:energy-coupling factor transport system substrate-specific component